MMRADALSELLPGVRLRRHRGREPHLQVQDMRSHGRDAHFQEAAREPKRRRAEGQYVDPEDQQASPERSKADLEGAQ